MKLHADAPWNWHRIGERRAPVDDVRIGSRGPFRVRQTSNMDLAARLLRFVDKPNHACGRIRYKAEIRERHTAAVDPAGNRAIFGFLELIGTVLFRVSEYLAARCDAHGVAAIH